MYSTFFRSFGLRDNPFNVNPDPAYLFLNEKTQRVLDDIGSAIHARKGLIVLTGEAGTGKTTLVNQLKHWLKEHETATAFIFNPHLGVDEIFDLMLADFGIANFGTKKTSSLARINSWLLEQYRLGRNAVLFLDEAQGLPTHVLEQIRVLLNHEMPQQLLQIVLSGQPELEQTLKRPDMQRIRQRISLRCHTTPLTLSEAHAYIQKRVSVAGGNGTDVFAPDAIEAAHHYSGGIPRVMNMLCEHAMMRAYFHQLQVVSSLMVNDAATQLELDGLKPARNWIEDSESEAAFNDSNNGLAGAEGTLDIRPIARESAAVAVTNELKTARATWFEVTAGANLDSQIRPLLSIEPGGNGNGQKKHEADRFSTLKTQSGSADELKVVPALDQEPPTIVAALPRHSQRAVTVIPVRPRAEVDRNLLLAKKWLRRWGRKCLENVNSMPRPSRDFWQTELPNSVREFSSRVSVLSKEYFAASKEQLNLLTIELNRLSKRQLAQSKRYLNASWEKTSVYVKSREWDKNLDSLLHWLQQPLPNVKIHRRIGH